MLSTSSDRGRPWPAYTPSQLTTRTMEVVETHTSRTALVVSRTCTNLHIRRELSTMAFGIILRLKAIRGGPNHTLLRSKKKMMFSPGRRTIGTKDSKERWGWSGTIKEWWTCDWVTPSRCRKLKRMFTIRTKKYSRTPLSKSRRSTSLPSRLSTTRTDPPGKSSSRRSPCMPRRLPTSTTWRTRSPRTSKDTTNLRSHKSWTWSRCLSDEVRVWSMTEKYKFPWFKWIEDHNTRC